MPRGWDASVAGVFIAVGCLSLFPACSDDPAGPATEMDLFFTAGPCSTAIAARIVVQVFDSEDLLVQTFERSLDEGQLFPAPLRLAPRGGDASRGWRIEAQLLDDSGVSISEQHARGGYTADTRRGLDLPFDDTCIALRCGPRETCRDGNCIDDFEPAGGTSSPLPMCPVVTWVDGTAGSDDGRCEMRDAPCASMQHALDEHAEAARGLVVFVHGGTRYDTAGFDSLLVTRNAPPGTPRALRIVRAWPGTGTPIVDATGFDKGFNVQDGFYVIDGFEIVGATEQAVSFNGADVTDCVLRNSELRGNGVGPGTFTNESGISLNNDATRITIADNVIRDSRADGDREADGIKSNKNDAIFVLRNVFEGNEGIAIDLSDSAGSVVSGNVLMGNGTGILVGGPGTTVDDNAVCGSIGRGVFISDPGPGSTLTHNTIVDNGGDAVTTGTEGTDWVLSQNIFAFNSGWAVGGNGTVLDRQNLYFSNALGEFEMGEPGEPASDLVEEDPRLTDRAACDVRLLLDSPAIGAADDGSDLGVRVVGAGAGD